MINVADDVYIDRSDFYFVVNINLRVSLTPSLIESWKDAIQVRYYKDLGEENGKDQEEPLLAEFFTKHFKNEHNPMDLIINDCSRECIIDADRLKEVDKERGSGLFQNIEPMIPIQLRWRTFINTNGFGLIIAEFHTKEPLHQILHRRLSLLYYNYLIISTQGIEYLFRSEKDTPIPSYISIETLLHQYKLELLQVVKRKIMRLSSTKRKLHYLIPAPGWDVFKSLSYETVIPIINLSIIKDDDLSQERWIQQHKELLAYYLIKPELFEMGDLSQNFIEDLISMKNVWSIDKSNFALSNYHGLLRINFSSSPQTKEKFTGFYLNSLNAYLYSTFITVVNYFTLRTFDDYLDERIHLLTSPRTFAHITDPDIREIILLTRHNESQKILLIVQDIVQKVQIELEEVENIDKLIDSDPHINLAYLIQRSFEESKWIKMVGSKLEELRKYFEMKDYVNEDIRSKRTEKLLIAIAVIEVFIGFLQISGVKF